MSPHTTGRGDLLSCELPEVKHAFTTQYSSDVEFCVDQLQYIYMYRKE